MSHMWEWGYGMGWFWMFIWWILIIGVVAAVIYMLLNSKKHNQTPSPGNNLPRGSAVEKLKERYAKGEINREEFKQMMEDLEE